VLGSNVPQPSALPGVIVEVQGSKFPVQRITRLPSTGSVLALAVIDTVGVTTEELACAVAVCAPVPHVMPKVTAPRVDSVTAWLPSAPGLEPAHPSPVNPPVPVHGYTLDCQAMLHGTPSGHWLETLRVTVGAFVNHVIGVLEVA
jgi:hypothetical protein